MFTSPFLSLCCSAMFLLLLFPHSIKPFLFPFLLHAFLLFVALACVYLTSLCQTQTRFKKMLRPTIVCYFVFSSRKLPSSTILFSSHLELVAACHPIIADHPDSVSVSHSPQMIMTLPSCSVTWAILGFYVPVCVCP